MKPLLLLVILAMTLTVYGQDITAPPKPVNKMKVRRYLIGVNFSPDVDYRQLIPGGSITAHYITNQSNKNGAVKFGFSTGLNFCVNITQLISIQTGLQYSNEGFLTIIPNAYFYTPTGLQKTTFKEISTYHYLDIPIRTNFTVGKKSVRFIAAIGVAPTFMLKTVVEQIYHLTGPTIQSSDTKSDVSKYIERVGLDVIASTGIDYRINDRMNLRIEPTFRFGTVRSNINDGTFSTHLYSGGVNISYFFGL